MEENKIGIILVKIFFCRYEIMQYDQADVFRQFIVQTTDERVAADLAGMKHKAKTKKDEV